MKKNNKHILSMMLATTAITLTSNFSVFAVNEIETAKQLQEASFKAYDRAFELNPNAFDADLSFNYGMYLKKHHKHEQAIDVFDHAIEKRPDFADALHQKGNSLRELKKFEESVYELEKAKELKPEDAKIYNSLGRSLASIGKLEEALEEFTKATELDEEFGEAYLNKGYCLEVLGRYEEAEEILKRNTQGTQTESSKRDAGVQVSSNMSAASVQTDSSVIGATAVATQTHIGAREIATQTHIVSSNAEVQTIPTQVSDSLVQTESSTIGAREIATQTHIVSSNVEARQVEISTSTDDLYEMDAKLKEHKQEDVTEVLEERSKAVATLASTSSGVPNNILNSISQRFNLNSMAVGASGDEDEEAVLIEKRTGFFINPFISRTHAKEFGSTSGFNGRSKGYSVGFDSKIHESLLFGFSYTKADSHMRFKQNHLGDVAKIDSNFFSLYGQYAPWHQKYFLSTVAIYGKSDIRSKALRGSSGTAHGRHKAISNILEVMAGSNQRFLQAFSVTPQLGLKYSKTKDAGYTEKSTLVAPNLVIGSTKSRDLEAIAGLKLHYRHVLRSDITLTPEIYGFASKRLNSREPLIRTKLCLDADTIVLPDITLSKSRLDFSYGARISISANNLDISAGYHALKARKLISHAGSLKVKINL